MAREISALSAALNQNLETQRLLIDELLAAIADKDAQITALNDAVGRLSAHITSLSASTMAGVSPAPNLQSSARSGELRVSTERPAPRDAPVPVQNPARGPDQRPPLWTEDEIILVAAALVENNWRPFNPTSATAQRLSALLQRMDIYPLEVRPPSFRNVNGVCRKSSDIATARPGYAGVKTAGAGVLTTRIAEEFHQYPEQMMARARAIEERLA